MKLEERSCIQLDDAQQKKKTNAFTIIKDDSTDGHGGYGVGAISLENMSPVIIDPTEGEAFIDMGAMHARSRIEKRVKILPNREDVPNGKLYWICWVVVERGPEGPYYHGAAASEIRIDKEAKRGYKRMPEHVKHMEQALKGKFVLDHIDDKSKQLLRDFLIDFDQDLWERASDSLEQALS